MPTQVLHTRPFSPNQPTMHLQHGSVCSRRQIKTNLSAIRTIFPYNEYQDRLSLLHLPTLWDFIFSLGERHFSRIVNDPDHPIFHRLIFNTGRISSRNNTIFRPAVCRTQKRAKSCFFFTRSYFSNHTIFLHFCEHLFF